MQRQPTWADIASAGSDGDIDGGEEAGASARKRGRRERGGEARSLEERALRRTRQNAALEFVAAERVRAAAGGTARDMVMGDVGDLQELDDEYTDFLMMMMSFICSYRNKIGAKLHIYL
jgi:hypothetical protein